MIINIGSGGATGYVLTISTSPNATITAIKDGKTYTATSSSNGIATFNKLTKGTWTVTVSLGSLSKTESVEISEDKDITINVNSVPEFTYSGSYKIYNAVGNDITSTKETQGNWKIKFLTSGTLTFTRLNGAADGIDVFCVGGGGNGGTGIYYSAVEGSTAGAGGGGGGGYAVTKSISVITGSSYNITVGGAGGNSVFGDNLVKAPCGNKGESGDHYSCGKGGNGGSGGGGGSPHVENPAGGTDGSNGKSGNGEIGGGGGGTGQDNTSGYAKTTREFGESGGTLYSSGGAGGGYGTDGSPRKASANTGNGGGGGGKLTSANGENSAGGSGSSGIVIIRNKR